MGETVTRAHLSEAVYQEVGLSRNESAELVELVLAEISDSLAQGDTVKLVADEGQGGLEPLARPDPANLPNNHLAYAGQWFFFALTALVIYVLALRARLRKQG